MPTSPKPVTDSLVAPNRRRRRSSGTVLLFVPRRGHAFTPTQVAALLGPTLLAAFLALVSYLDAKTGECRPGLRALARHIGIKATTGRKSRRGQVGVSLETARRRMRALAALGVIAIEDRGGRETFLYRIDPRCIDAAIAMLDELLPGWQRRRMIRCKRGRTLITVGDFNFIETQRRVCPAPYGAGDETLSEIAPSSPRQDARRCASLAGARSAPRSAGGGAGKPEGSEPEPTAPLHPRDAAVSDSVPPEERPSDEEVAAGFAAIRAALERHRAEVAARPPDPRLAVAREANERGRQRWIQEGVPPLPRRGFR